jgi:hypothetical protein
MDQSMGMALENLREASLEARCDIAGQKDSDHAQSSHGVPNPLQ